MQADDPTTVERIRQELRDVLQVLSEITGLPSNWSGTVHLVTDAGFKGQKPFSCDILLDAALASEEIRWRTLLHEALHALSRGYVREDFESFRGWEEGPVEKLQRLLRPVVLMRLGIAVDESIFRAADERHLYNRYLMALEEMQQATGIPERQFYVDLLAAPIKDRAMAIYALSSRMPREQRQAFLQVFSKVNSVLKGDIRWSLQPIRSNGENGSSA